MSLNTALVRTSAQLTKPQRKLDKQTGYQLALAESEADIATGWIAGIELTTVSAMNAIAQMDGSYQALAPLVTPLGEQLLRGALVTGGMGCIDQPRQVHMASLQRRR
jgi:hypothetical protein